MTKDSFAELIVIWMSIQSFSRTFIQTALQTAIRACIIIDRAFKTVFVLNDIRFVLTAIFKSQVNTWQVMNGCYSSESGAS